MKYLLFVLFAFCFFLFPCSSYEGMLAQEEWQDYDYWAQLCNSLIEAQKYQEAYNACDQAIDLNLKDAQIWIARGESLLGLEKYAEAVANYEQVLELQPDNSLALVAQCRLLSQLEKYQQALDFCQQALKIDGDGENTTPGTGSAWLNIAMILTERARVETKSRNYTQAQNFYQQALIAYDRSLAYNPQDAKIWTERGVILGILGRNEQAKDSHEWALKIRPNYYLALGNKCATLNRLSKNQDNLETAKEGYKEALKACEQAIEADKERWGPEGSAYVWNQRGNALIGLGEYQQALISIERAIVLQPDSADAWSDRAVALWYLAMASNDFNPDVAQMWVWKDKEIEGTYSQCRLVAASPSESQAIYPPRSLFNYAFDSIACAVTLNSASSQAWFNRGRILTSLRNYQYAAIAYEWALTGDVKLGDRALLADIWVNQSAVFWYLRRYQHSIDAAQEAIRINPDLAEAWYNQGLALMEHKDKEAVEEALRVYDQAIEIKPTDANFWTGKGIALAFLEKYEQALAAIQQALQLNPNHRQALQSQEEIIKQHLRPISP